ncbi:MAG: hypothetical protein ACJAR0_003934 [Candidatus Azotimanducaceae bacterium]|jgi:hypothetical protein
MNLKLHIATFLFFLTSLVCEFASAGLIVDRAIIIFNDRNDTKNDVVVINDSGVDKLFVNVEAFEVMNPGSPDEELVTIDRSSSPDFIASPTKLIVAPGSKSIVRLLNVAGRSNIERIYRVNFLPISAPLELESDDEADSSVRPMVEVVIAYQVLAIVLPIDPTVVPVISRTGMEAVFKNEGTANYLLSSGQQCDPLDLSDCRELANRRIYAGNVWKLTLPFDGPFSYTIRSHEGNSVRVVN